MATPTCLKQQARIAHSGAALHPAHCAHAPPGLSSILRSFYGIVEDVKRKPYDLLDFQRTAFDRDHLEFNVQLHDLEMQLQVRGGSSISWLAVGECRAARAPRGSKVECQEPEPAACNPCTHPPHPAPAPCRNLCRRRLSASPAPSTRSRCWASSHPCWARATACALRSNPSTWLCSSTTAATWRRWRRSTRRSATTRRLCATRRPPQVGRWERRG